MLSRLRSAAPHVSSTLSYQTNRVLKNTPIETTYYYSLSANAFSSKAATASADSSPSSNQISDKSEVKVNLNAMFWSKPCSLALAKDSPLRIEDPDFSGIKQFIFKLLLFYSKQSKSIRGANVVYGRILYQVDKPPIYDVFNLEKTFKTTFSLLVLHMWLVLRRLKEEGKEGTEFGQYLYEIYNHDLELRVAKAGVNLLLTKWMKDLEKIFYGNIVAYDAATTQEAKNEDLANVLWRNIFSEDGSDSMRDAASTSVQALARYTRRELTCLSMTEKEAMYSGNFLFTPLTSPTQQTGKKVR
ncbi:Ubiquinol-cytochrome C chaperone protein [Rhynchospora pubera]|uniref:Ubiquinol-cytochrome C chaperone protein n=1 Tax=Rhynchospora pubera TaxID=906938 RepID=A0AAV8EIC7_9POAL|nr:Ubiquinol-cytochrome C chaperone protein [Rhynchospora pubera]